MGGIRIRLIVAGVASLSLGVSPAATAAVTSDLAAPAKKEIALQLISSAENSSLDWRAQFSYIEDIDDGRGYTGGLVGFTSGTGDMLQLVQSYVRAAPRGNPLRRFVPALKRVDDSDSHRGLGTPFLRAWRRAAKRPAFRSAQERLRDRLYFSPAVSLAKADGLNALGQFAYFDAAVVHGLDGLRGIRRRATQAIAPPADGPTTDDDAAEVSYLSAFLDERNVEMRKEAAHEDVSRVDTAQRRFLEDRNLDLHTPLVWAVYGDPYAITG